MHQRQGPDVQEARLLDGHATGAPEKYLAAIGKGGRRIDAGAGIKARNSKGKAGGPAISMTG